MKFLFFNAVVAGALIYLFAGGGPDKMSFPDQLDQVSAAATSFVATTMEPPDELPMAAATPPPPPPVAIKTVAPITEVREIKPLVVNKPPVMETRPLSTTLSATARVDRKRDLLELAEDMELFSAEAATQ